MWGGRNGYLGRLDFHIHGRDVAGERYDRWAFLQDRGQNCGMEYGASLLGIDDPRGIERGGIKELVRIEFFERECIQDARFDVARDGDDRRAFLARIHQSVKQMNDARAGGSADCDRIAGHVSFGNGGKNSIFFVTDVNEIDPAVSAKCIDKRVESIADNAIAAFDASVGEHLTQDICDVSRH
jgi:hypothetical protein